MLLGTLGASLSGNLWTDKYTIIAGEGTLEQVRIFNTTSYFNKFLNTKVLSKRFAAKFEERI